MQGGILSVESLALPPSATLTKGWTIQPITELCQTVQRQRYPPASAVAGSSNLHMRISITLPPSIMIRDEKPLVGWFDKVLAPLTLVSFFEYELTVSLCCLCCCFSSRHPYPPLVLLLLMQGESFWSREDIADVMYEKFSRRMTFSTLHLTHTAVLQVCE